MSQNKIYVGSLSYDVNADDLREFFGQYGEIGDVRLIMDRETGRSKGFAFVTFNSEADAKSALESDGTDLKGRNIRVNVARDDNRSGGGGRPGGGRPGGGRGFGGGHGGRQGGANRSDNSGW